jgi:aminoglycoside phosphotransferase (APT) family kinase protein
MSDVPGIDVDKVSTWLATTIPGAAAPFTFEPIAGGHSNLTYSVKGAGGTHVVLRRPPLAHRLASAHDMGREHRIISSLAGSAVPVPAALGFCDDPNVNDAPFYVMAFVDGLVIRDREAAERELTESARTHASESLVDTLAAIHAVDIAEVGLDSLGRHDGYIARQLKRWHGQVTAQHTRDVPLIDELHDALAARIPHQPDATIVHGDYRLDNCMVDSTGEVLAVLDWEICTIGDPLADVGMLLAYWSGPEDEASAWSGRATTAPGFWSRDQVAGHYAERSGRDLSELDFYVAFAFWKLACIMEGVYARYVGGALGERDPESLAPLAQQVDAAAGMAAARLEALR